MAAHIYEDVCVKFNLLGLINGELESFLENIKNEKACIITVIGKTSLHSPNFKEHVTADALSKHIFEDEEKKEKSALKSDVTGYYDAASHSIFLHMFGITDTSYLVRTCKEMEDELKVKSFLEVWSNMHYDFAKTLLMLFCVSHIIMVVHPVSTFDLSYVYLFRALDTMRTKSITWFHELLNGVDVSPDWIQNGRPCSPRVLFVFESCQLISYHENSSGTDGLIRQRHKKQSPLKKLEHCLEDQIYRILRKSRVITNVSGNSLFAVPANQEFVYIFSTKPFITDFVGFVLNQIRNHCQMAKELDIIDSKQKNQGETYGGIFENGSLTDTQSATHEHAEHSFTKFLFDHINLALTRGFDDNVGRYPVPAYFEFFYEFESYLNIKWITNLYKYPCIAEAPSSYSDLKPTLVKQKSADQWRMLNQVMGGEQMQSMLGWLGVFVRPFDPLAPVHTWFEIVHRIGSAIYAEPKDSVSKAFAQTVRVSTDTDWKFSESRCTKVLPIASAAYQDNLPTHYTEDYHQTKLAHAMHVFNLNARGPAVQRFAKQLKWECEHTWKTGHQMCEVLSLTGNHCMNPLHRTDDDLVEDKSLPILQHCSQVKIVSTCDCGRKQATRDDPFDVKTANYDFYVTQKNQCCRDLERVDFPVFQASTIESHPARISPIPTPLSSDVEEKIKDSNFTSSSSHGNNLSKPELSEGNSDENSLINEMEQLTTEDQSQSQAEDERDEIVIRIQEDSSSSKEKGLTRQPSTTEYLPGMLHSESRLGLLPMFSSWSLVCLGPSSLYSHNIGLQDQPGFIPGTNYLLPWDVTVKLEQKERWPALWEGKRPLSLKAKKAIRDGPQFNVKIFIGVEYECYRGHRFMCSGPDRVLRVTNSGHVKDNASKVTSSDMPLYFPCPCRSSKPQLAQLMRIHVVTPKAPVHVTLHPKVQPAPEPCPLFFPTLNEPLKLSQSAYWVLRLPFVYEAEQGPYLPPREPVPVTTSRLLKGTYNIAEQQSSR